MEYNYGDGFVAEDRLVIRFDDMIPAWLIVKDSSRRSIKKYIEYAYATIGSTDEEYIMVYNFNRNA